MDMGVKRLANPGGHEDVRVLGLIAHDSSANGTDTFRTIELQKMPCFSNYLLPLVRAS